MTNDLVSNMLTHIRNASLVKHRFARVFFSKFNESILKVLIAENYIQNYQIEEKNDKPYTILITLKYKGWWIKKPFFSVIKRISKPGKRIFTGYKNFQAYISILRYKQGIAIISTSMGVMSHIKAIKLKKGGEILCYIE